MLHNAPGGGDNTSPQRPTGSGDPASFFPGLDASSSKQLAALTAAGNARRATQAGPSGVTSGPFVGGMHQQSHNYGHASPVLGHHVPGAPPTLANSAAFSMAGQDPTMLQQQQRQQLANMIPQGQQFNQNMAYKQRQQNFLRSLASFMHHRGTPLPSAVCGFPSPAYDPNTSPWKHLEPASEVGGIKVAGQDVDLLRFYTMVAGYGGSVKFQQQNLWPNLLGPFNLPDTLPQPMPDGNASTAVALAAHFMTILAPFEEATNAKGGSGSGPSQAGGQGMNQGRPPVPFNGQMQPNVPSTVPQGALQQQIPASVPVGEIAPFGGQIAPQTPQMRASGPMMNMLQTSLGTSPPNVTPQTTLSSGLGSSTGLDFEIDADGRKRKITDSDDMDIDGKRIRRKTGDTEQPVTPLRGEAMSSSNSHMPATPTPSGNARGQPHRRKIEYVPLAREVETAGGRDVNLIQAELQQLVTATGKPFRALEEWGRVHVDALTMSLRSRISTELSYSLTTLDILSTLRTRQQPESGLSIANCDDLVEELLDLLEESAFEGVVDYDVEIDVNAPIVTHRQLLNHVQDEMTSPFSEPVRKRGPLGTSQTGPVQRKGDIIKMVVNILRNFSSASDNQTYLAQHPTLTDLLLRLTSLESGEPGTAPRPVSSALSLLDVIVVRRDVMSTLVNIAGYVSFTGSSSPASDARKARRFFELVCSYIVDPTESLSPISWILQAGLPTTPQTRAPILTDAALEVFTRASQPDNARQALAKVIPHEWMYAFFTSLVHRLPLMEPDFLLALRETPSMQEAGGTWHSYIEKLTMALYSLAFLMPPSLKKRVREDRPLSFSRVMFRFVRKCLSSGGLYSSPQAGQEMRMFFYVATRRAVECVKVIEDGVDSFDTMSSNGGSSAPPLSFGVGYGEVGDKHVEKGNGMWGGRREDVLWLMSRDLDDVVFAELESLARVECDVF